MAKKCRAYDEEAWTNAKTICRLTARQVEMARALGMNPRKLPGLRPGPQERWKLPIGEFIEECHRKRFGGNPRDEHATGPEPHLRRPSRKDPDAGVPECARDPAWQLSDLACYFVNLADDLQQWLVHGSIDPDVLSQVREELLEIVKALDAGEPVSPIPAIPVPPRPTRRDLSRRGGREPAFDDEEIPF
jgi:hypothetical protein